MKELYKGSVSPLNTNIESKERQRQPLYSYEDDSRCLFLDSERPQVSQEEIEALVKIAVILKQIHVRLIMEGYTIKDGEFTPPVSSPYEEPGSDKTQ